MRPPRCRTLPAARSACPTAHVLLLEDDAATRGLLLDLFNDEGIEVTVCGSLRTLQSAVTSHPGAVVVSDSWSGVDNRAISQQLRAEIMALGSNAPVIPTTGRSWGNNIRSGEFGNVIVLPKPYDLDELMVLIRSAWHPVLS
jgi:DNA-binding response OmpR family regulator